MREVEIEEYFLRIIDDDKSMSNGIAAIKTLLLVLEKTNCEFRNWRSFLLISFSTFSHNNSGAGEHNQVSRQHLEEQRKADHFGVLRLRALHLLHHFGFAEARRQNHGRGQVNYAEPRKCIPEKAGRESTCHCQTRSALHHRWMRKTTNNLWQSITIIFNFLANLDPLALSSHLGNSQTGCGAEQTLSRVRHDELN